MNVQEIINDFGICYFEKDLNLDFNNINKCNLFFLDNLPEIVDYKNVSKYEQFEVLFPYKITCSKTYKEYCDFEIKFLKIFDKLWLYSKVDAGITDFYIKPNKISRYLPYSNRNVIVRFSRDDKPNILFDVEKKIQIESYAMLGLRGLAKTFLYFKNLHCLVLSNWSCFSVLFLKEDYYDFVNEIVKSEGMFLRKLKTLNNEK